MNTWRAGCGANSHVRFGGRSEETGGLKGLYRVSLRPYFNVLENTGMTVYNVLENTGMTVLVANARHIKAVPGRKTDVKDAEWLADLLRHGLIRGSAIPTRAGRELRELVRYRMSLGRQRAQVAHRIHKVLEGANVKLSSVVTDIMGVSGRAMLEALITGNASRPGEGTNEHSSPWRTPS